MNIRRTIAYVFSSSLPTGAERRFIAIAEEMEARGHSVVILLEEGSAGRLRGFLGRPVPQLRTYKWPWWVKIWKKGMYRYSRIHQLLLLNLILRFSGRIFWNKILKHYNVGIVHLSMTDYIAPMITVPCVFEVTSPDWASRIISEPRIVPTDIMLNAVSESVFEILKEGCPQRRVNLSNFLFPVADPKRVKPPNMASKQKKIVFAHRFIKRKNGLLFAHVIKKFLNCNKGWFVSLLGKGPEEQQLREILEVEINQGMVEIGYASDITHELKTSSIFVSLITPDNYPSQSIVEAMVYGNALLLSDCGRTKEKLCRGNAILVSLDEDCVLKALNKMSSDASMLRQMGEESYKLACERFSRDQYIDQLMSLYRGEGFR